MEQEIKYIQKFAKCNACDWEGYRHETHHSEKRLPSCPCCGAANHLIVFEKEVDASDQE
jgi:hypothetical protein